MIMYRTAFGKIEQHEVVRLTDKKVFFIRRGKERSENKLASWYSWHETWDEGKAHLVKQAEDKVTDLRLQLERAKGALGNVKGLKPL